MRVTIKAVVIIVISVVVAASVLMYTFSTFNKGTNNTKNFWNLSSNINKNTSSTGASSPPPIGECKHQGENCLSNEDCCHPYVCRKRTIDDTQECLPCTANTGDYCEENEDCCSGTCDSNACSS